MTNAPAQPADDGDGSEGGATAERPTEATAPAQRERAVAPKSPNAGGAAFEPFAVIETERDLPTASLWMCGITGGPQRWLRVSLDRAQPQQAWPAQVLHAIDARRLRSPEGAPELPFFGAVTGFVINHTRDHAVRYDRDGNEVETLAAFRMVPTLIRHPRR